MFIHSPISLFSIRTLRTSLFLGVGLCILAGCSRFRHHSTETVWVSARQTYLRDRVAAVSNHTATVTNGEALIVLEHGKRFLRVQTPKNETGWIEEHMVINAKAHAAFDQLAADHKTDPAAATATLRDELYMHAAPGIDGERFYLLPANAKVQLIERASVPKAATAGQALAALAQAKPATPAKKPTAPATQGKPATPAPPPAPPAPTVYEDWWLARDDQGRTGWLLAGRVDVDVPTEIEEYGEGQRFIGAWPIATVSDPGSQAPSHQVPEYLALMAPPQSGLPFDFNQVRVFTWNRAHHRYETGFRLHPIRGFLPVKIFTEDTPAGKVPAFSFLIPSGVNILTDPKTGSVRPDSPRTIEFEVIDTRVKRAGADTGPIPTVHEVSPNKKDEAAKKKRK